MNFKQQNDTLNTPISQRFISYCKLILQSQSFKKYFKIIFFLAFCLIEITCMTYQIFVQNQEFSEIQNEYTLFLIQIFIALIMIPLVSYNIINLIFKEVIFCCLLGCLFESFLYNQKYTLRFCAFFIFSQRTMNEIKKQKGCSIAIFIIILYPLIRYSIEQITNLPQLFQYFLLLIANLLFSFIKKPYLQAQQTKEHNAMIQKNIKTNNKMMKNNTNQNNLTQNVGETYGLQGDRQYLNQTKNDQNSLIEISNHINQYNVSINDEEAYANSSIDLSQIKNGPGIIKNTNYFLSEREIQLNKQIIKMQNIQQNAQQENQQYFNILKFNINMISTGIIILDQNKKLVYSNKQSKKIIKQNKKSIDEITNILSLHLKPNNNESQQSNQVYNLQQQKKNYNKYAESLTISSKLEKVFEDQRQNRENERNKTSKGKQKQEQYGSVIYNQYQSSKHSSKNQGLSQQTECLRKNFKKITTVEVMSSDYKQEPENKKKQQLDSQKYSIQIGENSQTQNHFQSSNLTTTYQNTKPSQFFSCDQSFNNFSRSTTFINKLEKQLTLPKISNFQEQQLSKTLQCLLPYNINKIFTKDNLSIDEIVSFLIKFSVSPQYQKLNTDNQIQSEKDSENSDSDSSFQFDMQRQITKKKTNLTEVNDLEDEEGSEYLDIQMSKQIENENNQIYKNGKLVNNNINLNQNKEITEKFKDSKKEKSSKYNKNKKLYDYFIQNNYLHLTVNLEDDKLQKQENTVIEIKLSVLIQIEQDCEKKFVQIEISDITKLMKQINKENLDVYKNKILSSVSHELRTPLNCSIQMLEMVTQNDEISDMIKQIFIFPALNSNCLLLNIINDILDLAQINYGKFNMQFSLFELNRIIAECINLISLQALQKNLDIDLDVDPQIPSEIHSDPNRIRQVLLNLLSNALKFTQEGKITIKISLKEEKLIQIEIEDTGCGIPEQKLSQIIKRFGKKDIFNFEDQNNKNQLNTMGIGLGLTIANNLAAGLGGNRKLQVTSTEKVGTKFQFWIVDHPPNKIGYDFIQKKIFSQDIVKWQSIQDNSFKSQQFQQQQIYVQNESQQNNNKSNSSNQGNSQSMVNQSLKIKKKNDESTNSLNPNKYIQPMQSLIRFNTEINQNILQSHIMNYQRQETNSIVSQNQSLYEGGKTKKFQLSLREQTQNTEETHSMIEQNLYPQFYGTIRTKTFDQNNSKLQVLENYLRTDSQTSQKTKIEGKPQERIIDPEQQQQILNQQMPYHQNSPINQNKSKNKDPVYNSLQTIIEHNNKSSFINFPSIKSSIQCPNKPNSDLQPNIILSALNQQTLHLSSHAHRNLKQNNIKALFTQLPNNISINSETSNQPCINLFKSSHNTQDQNVKQIKSKDIKEGYSDIINSNEIQNIQLPNQFNFQKVSEKRLKECNHTSPTLPKQQINSTSIPQVTNDFGIKIKFQDTHMDQIYQNEILQDRLLQQDANIQSGFLTSENESAIEWGSTNKTSEDQKQIVMFNKENIDIDQTTSEEKKIFEQSQQSSYDHYLNKKAIKSPKTPTSPYHLSIYSNKDLNKYIQSNADTPRNKRQNLIEQKEDQVNNNNIQQIQTQPIIYNQTVKQQMQKYNQNRKCKCSNILIVDDNEFNIYALEMRLKQYDFIIDRAISGIVALQLVKKKFEGQLEQKCCKQYSLIFMDIEMPNKNGYDTTRDILSYYKEKNIAQPPPISACTAYVQQSEQNKAREAGMLYYITKPISQQKLEDVLTSVIKNTNFNH